MQSFVRGEAGQNRLQELREKIQAKIAPALETVALNQQLSELNAELKEVHRRSGFFGLSPVDEVAEATLKDQIEKIEARLRIIGAK